MSVTSGKLIIDQRLTNISRLTNVIGDQRAHHLTQLSNLLLLLSLSILFWRDRLPLILTILCWLRRSQGALRSGDIAIMPRRGL